MNYVAGLFHHNVCSKVEYITLLKITKTEKSKIKTHNNRQVEFSLPVAQIFELGIFISTAAKSILNLVKL